MVRFPRSESRPFPEVEGVQHRFIEAGGLRMHVAEAGQGDPLVLLHGWPQHWYEWRHQIPVLSQHYRVICPDLRGLGWSDAPPRGTTRRAWRRTSSTSSTRSGREGEADRPRLGRLVRVHHLLAASRAHRALSRTRHPAAVGNARPEGDRQPAEVRVPVVDREPDRLLAACETALASCASSSA